ncbi:hypothetical protein MBRU_10480 [Mycolicibacterium brumae DSM 44177]|nr:hypothetical protein MBRU_10480 [Mycolicibacterium brumae DSM 44177]
MLMATLTLLPLAAPAVGVAAVTTAVSAPVVDVQPPAGSTVGVAHPVIVSYGEPIPATSRAAAERSIKITAPADVTGHFEWLDDYTVQFVPDEYWPAHSQISATVDNVPLNFNTGAAVLGVASISGYSFTVSVDGVTQRRMPASMGKAKFPTPQGSFTVLGKENPVVMDSRTIGIPLSDPEGYKLTVNYAVRITWGGVYVHSAPWSTGSQGYANVSHGCINLSPDNAAWYYNMVGIGDPVQVKA